MLMILPLFIYGQERIMVVADPHVLATSLVEEGDAFDAMMNGQRKMLDMSEAVFMALVDTALVHQPALVLIPGDLTKDSEKASHDMVVAQLNRLQAAGINTLVIPGNHDIGGQAYAYRGAEEVQVENMTDDEWENTYATVYQQVVAKDPNSHSFVSEPLHGVSVLGIDASHDAGEGYVTDATLDWLLEQADSANMKGNMILAMCHWQVLEHVDKGGVIMESGRLQNADMVRDSLMAHHVRLVLTGHVHVNNISTYRDTLGMSGDSIVEISTGAPITYPCPYRWLTISRDRSTVAVQTENITALATQPDMQAYSREWMRSHAEVMIPALSVRLFDNAEVVISEYLQNNVPMGGSMVAQMVSQCMPKTDAEKKALVDKHLSSTVIDLYLLHSDANEPDQPAADSLAQALYAGVDAMIHELTDAILKFYASIQKSLIDAVVQSMKEPVQSLVEDCTHWTSTYHRDRTDDLHLTLTINTPQQSTSLENNRCDHASSAIYDILGRRVAEGQTLKQGIYIQNGKKILR